MQTWKKKIFLNNQGLSQNKFTANTPPPHKKKSSTKNALVLNKPIKLTKLSRNCQKNSRKKCEIARYRMILPKQHKIYLAFFLTIFPQPLVVRSYLFRGLFLWFLLRYGKHPILFAILAWGKVSIKMKLSENEKWFEFFFLRYSFCSCCCCWPCCCWLNKCWTNCLS